MNKIKVLFLSSDNSTESQIAEAFLSKFACDRFEVYSAGVIPGTLNPYAVKVMQRIGIDISAYKPKSLDQFHEKGEYFDYIITIGDRSLQDFRHLYPNVIEIIHWDMQNTPPAPGKELMNLESTKKLRNKIKTRVEDFIQQRDLTLRFDHSGSFSDAVTI